MKTAVTILVPGHVEQFSIVQPHLEGFNITIPYCLQSLAQYTQSLLLINI
jgi:3-deoxy-D-manno-octulosonic-acid transferase